MKTKIRIFIVPIIFTFLAAFSLSWYSFTPLRIVYIQETHGSRRANRIGTILDLSSGLKIDEQTAKRFYLDLLIQNEVKDLSNQEVNQECTMSTCFNLSRCLDGFSVYVYTPVVGVKISPLYSKILKAMTESPYVTTDPAKACLFVPPYDTLDRDPLSVEYQHGFKYKLTLLPYWNQGQNHFLFNFFSGTFPSYSHSTSSLNLEFGEAILVKASVSDSFHRRGFDISSPLLPKDFRLTDRHPGALRDRNNLFPVDRKYLLSFKGKRYVWGVGSVARNALSNLHNSRDIVLLTTCIHGANWYKYEDKSCSNDNTVYTEYEFEDLMLNSSFCLVPRGRRLGSFRFLESLQFGCVPVSLSNGYVLPFSDVIDWGLTALNVDERNLFQVPAIIRSISADRLLSMRLQAQFIWETYFSSTRKYVFTILEILKDRIYSHISRSYEDWNFPLGAIFNKMQAANNNNNNNNNLFTAVIHIYGIVTGEEIFENLSELRKCKYLYETILVTDQLFRLRDSEKLRILSKMELRQFQFQTEAILNLDFEQIPNFRDLEFAFEIWKNFPDRLVGFSATSHFWDANKEQWAYNNNNNNNNNKQFSLVPITPAFYHKHYHYHFTKYILIDSLECDFISLNFHISHISKYPPILIRATLSHSATYNTSLVQSCFDQHLALYAYNPLSYSHIRIVANTFI